MKWLVDSVSRLMPNKSQRAYCNYLESGHTVILDWQVLHSITVFWSCLSFPSLGDQCYIQGNWLVYETDLCSGRNLFFTWVFSTLRITKHQRNLHEPRQYFTNNLCLFYRGRSSFGEYFCHSGSRYIWIVYLTCLYIQGSFFNLPSAV